MLNNLHSSVSICACKNRSFGTGINGTVINALRKSTTILKFNGDVTRTSNLDIEGYIVANPTSANTYEFFQFVEESKSRIEAEKKTNDNWFLEEINPKIHIDLYGTRTLATTDPELLNHVISSYVKIHPMPQSQICLHEAFQKYLTCGSIDCCLIKDVGVGSDELLRDQYWSNLQDNTFGNPFGIG